jgi:pilus assembly protein CpaB
MGPFTLQGGLSNGFLEAEKEGLVLSAKSSSLLGVAAIFSLLASVLARSLVSDKTPTEVTAPPAPSLPRMTVIVANREIEFLSVIKPEAIHEHAINESDVPGDQGIYAHRMDEVAGRIAMTSIHAGSLIHRADLKDREGGVPLALDIQESMRAITIRVDDVKGVGGFLARGNLVDVVAVVPSSDHQASSSAILAQGIRVLAVDQDAASNREEAKVVRAVTLEVSPNVAETIFRAEVSGSLKLTLRHPKDKALHVLKVIKAEPAPNQTINLIQGRDSGPLKVYGCESGQTCPSQRGE